MKYWKHIFKDKPQLKTLPIKVKKMPAIKYEPMFADTETSKETEWEKVKVKKGVYKHIERVRDTWVYLWMCSVGDYLYCGYYLHEFFELLEWIVKYYGLNPLCQMDIWFHNASYDISYMYDLLFKFNGGSEDMEMLFSEPQKLIALKLNKFGLSIKCTYRLSNRSLEKWCEDLKVEHKKQKGIKDYKAVYYPWDYKKLPAEEYKYAAYDIISMKECFYKELSMRGYTFANCPMTQTGFVRKEFQRRFSEAGSYWKNKKIFDSCRLDINQYNRLVRASAGGYTAVNCYKQGIKVECEQGIGHLDFSSHYPTQQKIRNFPMRPKTIKEIGDDKTVTLKELDFLYKKGYYFCVDIVLQDAVLKDGVCDPCLLESKITTKKSTKIEKVNGKILNIKGQFRICCVDLDLFTIFTQYDISAYKVLACDTYTTRSLPPYIIDTIDDFFKAKSEIKIQLNDLKKKIEKETDKNKKEELEKEYEDTDVKYSISKQMLNGIFGCTDYQCIRPIYVVDSENFKFKNLLGKDENGDPLSVDDIKEINSKTLEEYYDRYTTCVHLQWGVWTTAFGRYELHKVISDVIGDGTGSSAFNYSDTDSVFYENSHEIEKRVDEYRAKCRKEAEMCGFYVTLADGTKVYYHDLAPEDDHLKSKTFKALHAKCYALEPEGKLKCTIAGVAKKNKDRTITREQELGTIDDLDVGKVFVECGGTRADYSTIREYVGYTGGGCAIIDAVKEIRHTENDILSVKKDVVYV